MNHPGGPRDVASAPTVALPQLRLSPGTLFADRYEILAPLGEGGMGAVFRVLDRELREEIALKVLRPEIEGAPGMLDRFRREVKLARRVTHPNVARTFDLGAAQGVRYLTMELIAGESIAKRFPPGVRAPMAEALRIAGEVARGLAAAHAVGVVHRDLKPDNIMVARAAAGDESGDRVVITDFGIAREADLVQGDSRTVGIVGTPAYMAPEQLEGHELDGRTDVYALGLVLYELLTGQPAFEGDTLYSLAAARLSGRVPDPRTRDATIPESVAKLVLESLAPHREDRPDAQAMLERIDVLRGGGAGAIERTPRLPSLDAVRQASREPRNVAVLPLSAPCGTDETRTLAADLTSALVDATAKLKGLRLVPAPRLRTAIGHQAELDPVAVGRAVDASFVLEGSLRTAAARARVRLRLVDVERKIVSWADRVEGDVGDPFTLEDEIVRVATETLRARETADSGRGGPTDPRVRTFWERARTAYTCFGLASVREAIKLAEEGLEHHPGDPWLMSILGAALTRAWLQTGANDRDMIARAEEVSLRALALDPTIGETYHTIAALRWNAGDGRAAVRALQEALSRAPLHAGAHCDLGRMLVETGYVKEGLERLELVTRLEPQLLNAYFEIARVHALVGDRQASERALRRAEAIGGDVGAIFPRVRMVFWYRDREEAARVANVVRRQQSGATWENAAPLLETYARGELLEGAREVFERLANDARAAPRHRAFLYELAAEYFGATEQVAFGLEALERGAELPLTDILWMDKCPALDSLRDDPRFSQARAAVAARAADLWD